MTKTKRFHIAFWLDRTQPLDERILGGVNIEAKSISDAIDVYTDEIMLPDISNIKYIIEIGKDPITFGIAEC